MLGMVCYSGHCILILIAIQKVISSIKKELGMTLIDNLIEFRQALTCSVQQNNARLFLEAAHKVTVTLCILADKEFNEIIEELKRDI